MASFGWKRKVGERVSKSTLQRFEAEAETAGDSPPAEDGVDWTHAVKRRREVLLEDCEAKSERLKGEGALLAEQGRPAWSLTRGDETPVVFSAFTHAVISSTTGHFTSAEGHWEAIKKWDEAIQLTPENHLLYEMKSQVLSILQEVFPAVKAAEMAVKLKPMWWEGWQTLGRAQLSLGEVDLAVRSFQVAVHLSPSDPTLREQDLAWAQTLQRQRRAAREKTRQEDEAQRLVLDAPELRRDYDDFESDEVLEACAAVAERQRRLEELRRTTVVLDADGNVRTVVAGAGGASASQAPLVKARGL